MTKEKTWEVETTKGETVRVDGEAPIVSEHGHLEFSDGSVFARNEWQYVIPE